MLLCQKEQVNEDRHPSGTGDLRKVNYTFYCFSIIDDLATSSSFDSGLLSAISKVRKDP